jgi:DNA-binding CsgD family transcriptional regulator
MATSVVGRDAELAALNDFLAGIPEGATLCVLEGEAGMGKTTLWRACLDQAAQDGLRTLEAEPAASEAELSFAGLGDLLDPVLDEALEPLPAGQRAALARALVLDDVEGPPPDAHAVGVALLGALRALALDGPLVVAIDDAQWLDAASTAALAYAGRRLRAEPVGVVVARRTGLVSSLTDELLRSLGDRAATLEVGPLDASALHRVIVDRLGTPLPRPLLAEVQQAAGGNPFYAIEIVRTLQRRGTRVSAGRPLPVPDSLHDLIDERLATLPEESGRFLLAAAAHAHPTITVTEAASGIAADAGLDPAVGAGIVELDGSRIRFTHPLLAAGVLEAADPRTRADVHARLADLLEDPEARAWQLAASVQEPNEDVAAVVENAAEHARMRGGLRPAALLLDCAERLTPTIHRDEGVRRAVEAAYLHFEAGDSRRAEAKIREVIAPLEAGPVRARALLVLARIRLYDAPEEARGLFLQVIDEAVDDHHSLALAHEGVAACSVWACERWEDVLSHTGKALELAAEIDHQAIAADAILARLGAETLLGRPSAAATEARALELQAAAASELRAMDQPFIALAECWTWTDSYDRALDALEQLAQRAQDLGDENARPWLCFLMGDVARRRGDLEDALELVRDGQEAAEQSSQPLLGSHALALESLILAELGRVELARETALRALAAGSNRVWLIGSEALGHLALSLGRPDEALSHFVGLLEFVRTEGIVEPGATRFIVDQVAVLTDLGRSEEAIDLLDWYEGNAERLGRVSALANCARCRGLLAAQAGDLGAAFAAFEEALELHGRVRMPLDEGRTLLALGAAQRRAKRRREARGTLEHALAVFEGIGAALWAERARGELKRISGRASTPGALTPAEQRVAALVCEGKTNREVAAALYLSDRTVEGHLARIFGKLGIRHRTELAGALQTRGIDPSNTGDAPVSAESSAP